MDQNLKLKRENSNGSRYLRENMEPLSLPHDPSPSGLLLQGGKVSSRSSSEVVWLVIKWKENERK